MPRRSSRRAGATTSCSSAACATACRRYSASCPRGRVPRGRGAPPARARAPRPPGPRPRGHGEPRAGGRGGARVTVRAAPFAVRSSRDPRRLDALHAEWSALFDAAGEPSPFLSWEWLGAWWRAFGGRREPWILEARDGAGSLAGLLLLAGGAGPLGLRRWRLLGNGVTGADGLDVLARAADASAVRE